MNLQLPSIDGNFNSINPCSREPKKEKLCPKCRTIKPVDAFPRRRSESNLPNSYCRPCTLAYQRSYYQSKDRQNQRDRVRANSARYRMRNRLLMRGYLESHPCVDCGENDPIVLDFDHVRAPKIASVSRLSASNIGWSRVEAEIAKCEVRCANCHRRRTAEQFGWKVWKRVSRETS